MTKTHSNEHLPKEKDVAQKETQIFLAEHIFLSSSLSGTGVGGRGLRVGECGKIPVIMSDNHCHFRLSKVKSPGSWKHPSWVFQVYQKYILISVNSFRPLSCQYYEILSSFFIFFIWCTHKQNEHPYLQKEIMKLDQCFPNLLDDMINWDVC